MKGSPKLGGMETWTDRLGRSGLRSFTDAEGRFWLEQNAAKSSKRGKFAREGHRVAWEFTGPGGTYTGRMVRPDEDVFFLQVKVLSGQALEHPVADPSRKERSDRSSGVTRALGKEGSKPAGRNMK